MEPTLRDISDLVKSAFGKKARCDVTGNSLNSDLFRIDGPFLVVRKRFLGFAYQPIGKFDEDHSDGSVLEVFSEHEPDADVYANLYEQKFGRRPEIRVGVSMPAIGSVPYTTKYQRFGNIS